MWGVLIPPPPQSLLIVIHTPSGSMPARPGAHSGREIGSLFALRVDLHLIWVIKKSFIFALRFHPPREARSAIWGQYPPTIFFLPPCSVNTKHSPVCFYFLLKIALLLLFSSGYDVAYALSERFLTSGLLYRKAWGCGFAFFPWTASKNGPG